MRLLSGTRLSYPSRMARRPPHRTPSAVPAEPNELRIIGGEFRSRKIAYHGDPRVRPMKDRVRQAVFDLLAVRVKGRHAIDLFAGTGALGLEALSRGACHATFIEQHRPTARILTENIARLEASDRSTVVTANTFFWWRRGADLGADPWVVFCSPPYAYYLQDQSNMVSLLDSMRRQAPAGSSLVVESDTRFDFNVLGDTWDVRDYAPARIGLWHAGERAGSTSDKRLPPGTSET
jgi:16S rRNA (guanine(966)-N(2))-methyltransferase RsmD